MQPQCLYGQDNNAKLARAFPKLPHADGNIRPKKMKTPGTTEGPGVKKMGTRSYLREEASSSPVDFATRTVLIFLPSLTFFMPTRVGLPLPSSRRTFE